MDKKKIGNFISALRKEKGMTQRELADKLYVSDRTVSKWERGAGLPDASLMIALSDLLGITVNELLTGEKSPDRPSAETRAEVKNAVSVFYRHVRTREKLLRRRIIAVILLAAVVLGAAGLILRKAGEDRILFPPSVTCELLQRDTDVEARLLVDRRNSGVYDYICAYDMDKYGNVALQEKNIWQSYTDPVPGAVYQGLKELCSGEITCIDVLETGYLACCYGSPSSLTILETDGDLRPVFEYTLDTRDGALVRPIPFVLGDTLYIISYDSDAQRICVISVDKKSGQETRSSFDYGELAQGSGSDGRTGSFLFDRTHLWVKDGVLYFAETSYRGGTDAVLAAYDLEENKPVHVQILENAQVVTVRREPENGQALILINPMGYAPLALYTVDDTTLEVLNITFLALPNEYLTRQDSMYGAETYYIFDEEGDMDARHVAVLFGDTISRERMEDDTASCILAVYDRASGDMVWRGRLQLPVDYEICGVSLAPAGQ